MKNTLKFVLVISSLLIAQHSFAAVLASQPDDTVPTTACATSFGDDCSSLGSTTSYDYQEFVPSAGTLDQIHFKASTSTGSFFVVELYDSTSYDGLIYFAPYNYVPDKTDGDGSMHTYVLNASDFSSPIVFNGTDTWGLVIFAYSNSLPCSDLSCYHAFTMAGNSTPSVYFEIADSGGFVQNQTTNITSDTTWYKGITYVVSGNIQVTSGHTLTIEPGTVVKFDTLTLSSLTINGTLDATGYEDDTSSDLHKIFFTSLKDDSFGLDTNGDGNTTSPAPGDWGGIIIGSGGSATLDFATVRYAGASGSSEAQVYNDGGTLSMDDSTVSNGTTYGVKNYVGTASISGSDLAFNDYGFYLAGGTASLDGANKIHDNSYYGVYNNTISTIDAEHNYWGDSTGPYYSTNTSGLGNPVSSHVDFDPYDAGSHYLTGISQSVSGDELRWENVSASPYSTELSAAISTWDGLGNGLTFVEDNSTPTLEIYKVNMSDMSWKGKWDPLASPDNIKLNSYYLDNDTSDQIQNTITHELGHALGLAHSYTGNVMYFLQTPQTSLGSQDESDYYYLWPNH